MSVIGHDQVRLYGQIYRIRGPVQRTLVSVFPGKVVIGDYTRDTKQLTSSWIGADWIGGLGKERLDVTTDSDRFDWATLETRYKRQLTLLPLAVDAGAIAGKAHVRAGADYSGSFYAAFDDTVQKWVNATATWTQVRTLGDRGAGGKAATDAIVFRGSDDVTRVYFGSGDDIDHFDGTTWTLVQIDGGAQYFAIHDDKLFVMGTSGQLRYSIDGTTFVSTSMPRLPLPVGYVAGMAPYFDAAEDPALYVSTKAGLYVFDETAAKLRATHLVMPDYPSGGRGIAPFQGTLYVSSGLDVYTYTTSIIAHMGLNRDYGLPADYSGDIVKLAPAQSWLFAVLDAEEAATGELPRMFAADGPFTASVLPGTKGRGALFAWDGTGWHTVFAPSGMTQGMKWVGLSMADSRYRLWFGADSHAYYMDMSRGIFNPLRNPATQFATSGALMTGWFDAGWAELEKLGISVKLRVRDVSATETVQVEYALNESSSWNPLATITTAGLYTVRLGAADEGVPFTSIRFKIVLTRGTDSSKTPIVDFIALEYLKLLDVTWGWSFSVDASGEYGGLTPAEIETALENAADSNVLGEFQGTVEGTGIKRMVRITRLAESFQSGEDGRGVFQVSVAEL